MTTQEAANPFYKRFSLNLLSICLLCLLLYFGQGVIIPFCFAILLATLLIPAVNFLQKIKVPKIVAIIISIVVSLTLIGGIIYFLSHQIAVFAQDFDAIKERILNLKVDLQKWVGETFNISTYKQNEYLKDTAENIKESGPGFVGKTVVTITDALSYVVFLPVYTFLLLYYKNLIKRFFVSLFKDEDETKIVDVLHQSRTVGLYYVLGLMIDMSIVFTLNTAGFLILGIKYAIFLALFAALLNLIPYIGMLIANIFCMLITLVSSDNTANVVWVAVILAVVQVIDNNFLMPMIVGNKVRINALVTILGLVVGGALCGIAGMFLAIPGVAIIKVIFDRVDTLKPWGMLLGDDITGVKKKKKKAIV